jgi:hypothetical protein
LDQPSTASSPQYDIEYPLPPRVHWAALLAAWALSGILIDCLAPKPLQDLLNSLVVDAWALYICLWIRKLDADSMSVFWCGAFVVAEIGCFIAMTPQHRSPGLETTTITLGFASLALWIILILVVRADLLKHYNDREAIGLHLKVLKSIAYSFLYFQYHLYKIAEFEKRQADSSVTNRSRAQIL